MSKDTDKTKAKSDAHEKGATFDMYHFFSRKDVIVAALLILALMIYIVYRVISGGQAV